MNPFQLPGVFVGLLCIGYVGLCLFWSLQVHRFIQLLLQEMAWKGFLVRGYQQRSEGLLSLLF